MSSPTIKDVAKLAGVSISTVSRVMNESKPVSPEARRKVLDAINKLDFKPNELARSLVMKKSNIIGVVVKDIGIHYMAQIIRGLEEIGRMYKFDILLTSTYGNQESEKKAVDFLVTKQVEGIVLLSENVDPEVIVKLKDHKLPYMLIDEYYTGSDFHTVTIDYTAAAASMCEFLINLGHEKILYMLPEPSSPMNLAKLKGYKKVMKDHELEDCIVEVEGISFDDGYNIGDQIKQQIESNQITAVFASSDDLAIGFINYCYDKDIRVPSDISVAGFGDSQLSANYRPRLTTVQQPFYDIGAIAMRRLIKVLQEDYKIKETTYLLAQIMERESSARIK